MNQCSHFIACDGKIRNKKKHRQETSVLATHNAIFATIFAIFATLMQLFLLHI